jgi:thioredoxin
MVISGKGGLLLEPTLNINEFNKKTTRPGNPILVEFWATWCAPCRAMTPALEKVESEFLEKVELLQINADESPEVLQSLKVFGIPTVIAFSQGKELFRKTGSQNVEGLRAIFDAAYKGEKPVKTGLSPVDRMIRMTAGAILVVVGVAKTIQWLPLLAGMAILFSAVYDRCPIYAAASKWLKSKLSINTSE